MGKKKNRKNRRGGLGALLRSLLGGIGWLFVKLVPVLILASIVLFAGLEVKKILWKDRLLSVQEIKIVPSDVLSSQSVRILEDKLLGKNILAVDLNKIISQIELGPGAQSVRAVREMPGTIRIEIQKRRPVANVRLTEDGKYAIVADDSYIIDIRPEADPAWVLMEDFGEPVKVPKIGMRIQNKGFREALKLMTLFRNHPLSRTETITRIKLDPYGDVTIRLGAGPDFLMGRKACEQLGKLTQVMDLFKTEPRDQIEYMDLKYDRIAVKKKASS